MGRPEVEVASHTHTKDGDYCSVVGLAKGRGTDIRGRGIIARGLVLQESYEREGTADRES